MVMEPKYLSKEVIGSLLHGLKKFGVILTILTSVRDRNLWVRGHGNSPSPRKVATCARRRCCCFFSGIHVVLTSTKCWGFWSLNGWTVGHFDVLTCFPNIFNTRHLPVCWSRAPTMSHLLFTPFLLNPFAQIVGVVFQGYGWYGPEIRRENRLGCKKNYGIHYQPQLCFFPALFHQQI